MQVGIDTLAMATSRYALDLATLAKARDIDPAKFSTGLGQLANASLLYHRQVKMWSL